NGGRGHAAPHLRRAFGWLRTSDWNPLRWPDGGSCRTRRTDIQARRLTFTHRGAACPHRHYRCPSPPSSWSPRHGEIGDAKMRQAPLSLSRSRISACRPKGDESCLPWPELGANGPHLFATPQSIATGRNGVSIPTSFRRAPTQTFTPRGMWVTTLVS